MISLSEEIIRLISLRQEGGYWDFKREWYTNKTDLLHDIICMANNLCNCTAYIVIGVDEENDYKICDVVSDLNRKNTQKIVDFLKDKKFAGGIRPIVHVDQVNIADKIIDVIVIDNSTNTPYFLTEHFEGVCANNIYTRIMDTNTPINKSADINNIEYLWRKRFHIDDTPLEKFRFYLENPNDWESTQDQDMGYFYRFAPEYTISCERDETTDGYEYYIFGQVNTTPSWWLITLKYHQTAIERFQGISLDGGRSFVVAPSRAYDLYDVGISSFGYYVRDSLRIRLLNFFHQKETTDEYSYRRYTNAIVFFESDIEKERFFTYIRENIRRYQQIYSKTEKHELPFFPEMKGYVMDAFRKDYQDAVAAQKMLIEFRNKPQSTMEETK